MATGMSNIPASLADNRGRNASYLRISITDRCNLKCAYCVSCERQEFIPHERILRYEEFYRLVAIAVKMGVRKVRVTGGEPFARRGAISFLKGLRSRFPQLDLTVTTNATLIEPYIDELASLGLKSFNISLDSFDRATFAKITGSDLLARVQANITRLARLGQRVKINAVALAGVTDIQMGAFVDFAMAMPVDIRFIEFMPMGRNTLWDESRFISWQTLHSLASSRVILNEAPAENSGLSGPAKMYSLAGGKGRLGFISAVSDHFCSVCNRLRITSDGRLRTCLFADKEVDLGCMLRHRSITDEHIAKAVAAALAKKPLGSELLKARKGKAVAGRQMVAIGG